MGTSGIVKVIGMSAAVAGLAVDLLSDWVKDKKIEEEIEAKVNEAIAKRDNERKES